MADTLLSLGADINATNNDGMTALHISAMTNYSKKVLETLLFHGADINKKDNKGNTALRLASKFGKKGAVKILKAHGATN